MRLIQSTEARAREADQVIDELRRRAAIAEARIRREAARIVTDVRRRGDAATRHWARRLDGLPSSVEIEVPAKDLRRGWDATPRPVRRAIKAALRNIRMVAERQRPRGFTARVQPGVRIEQRVQPLARVGCYVPGGRYPLPSTLLMTVAPAASAGVPDITVACPRPSPAVLCAALEAGATRVIRLGGAQAIASLAYGTETIGRVDKIVGPGNAWVAAAKTIVSGDCEIDFHAGPSEIVIFSDTGNPEWIAADLVAQAEHDAAARAIFVTTRLTLAHDVMREVDRQLPAAGPARVSLDRLGAAIVARSREDAIAIVNRLAPEHAVCDRAGDARDLVTSGTIFVGRWSAQALGDYATGSNHVLPTGGAAQRRGGLSTADFVRTHTVQTVTARGLRRIAPTAITLARAEGLAAHARSIEIRL
jgi:histidinol dehydrogenase